MKKILVLFVGLLIGCNVGKEIRKERFITIGLPKGVSVYGFNEKFDKPRGKWELYFFLKNETGKQIEYPQIDGELYIDGKLEGTVTGGLGKHLNILDSGVVSYSWILPRKIPDSIIFKWISN